MLRITFQLFVNMNFNEIKKRVENELESRGIKRVKFAEILGTPETATKGGKSLRVKAFFNNLGKGKIDHNQIKKVAEFFRVSEDWILFGDKVKIQNNENSQITVTNGSKNNVEQNWISSEKKEILERIAKEKDPEIIKALTEALKLI